MIRIAVLGCGRIGVMHAANIAAHPRAVLAGVFDIHAPAAQAVGLPLQKLGPLFGSRVTFDLRRPVPILGSTAAYQQAVERSASERLVDFGVRTTKDAGTPSSRIASSLSRSRSCGRPGRLSSCTSFTPGTAATAASTAVPTPSR